MTDLGIEVRPVKDPGDWRAFYDVRRAVYRRDPAAVRPLRAEETLQLDPQRHPFWQHAEREAFLCRRNGRPVGRIVAILDRLHQEYYADRTGFFGFFECADEDDAGAAETTAALLDAASKWLVDRGCDRMRGPVNPSMKGEFGVVVTGNDEPPAIMMAHTPARYDALLKGYGLAPAHDFYAYTISRAGVTANRERWGTLTRTVERIMARHPDLSFATATRDNLVATLADINVFANRVREVVWGFVPITDAELDFLSHRIRRVMVPELVLTVRRGDEMVGYLMAVPDVNWALARARGPIDLVRLVQMPFLLRRVPRVRMFALGAEPKLRAVGIVPVLFHAMIERSVPRFEEFEFSWISQANLPSLRALQHILPMAPSKTYRLYEAPLPPG